jgi:hypothetical protein
LILATNFTTNLVQASGDTVIVGTNVTYYLNNGPGLDPTNFVPFGARSNDNASVTASAGDDAGNLLWRYVIIDALGHQYFSQGVTSNFFLAEELTNHGHIFAGTIKTNLDINGTLYTDSIAIRMGPPRDPGSAPNFPPAPPELILSGTANASASPATTAIVTNKLPFSSWNATYAVTGYGTVGGVVSNNFYTNNYTYLTTSNVEVLSVNPSLPNPPYTNISTNLYTNYTVINTTNSGFVVKGTVQQTFWKIVQH